MTTALGWDNLPPLAGLCSYADALREGMSVDRCVAWMKRHHYLLVRLHQIFTARITAEPVYELKTAFSLHSYLCAEHATAFRQRVSELREPPLGLEVVPHTGLERLCDEVLGAPSHVELTFGLYECIVPALVDSLKQYLAVTNLLADAPSVRVTRFCLMEMEDIAGFGRQAVACLVDEKSREQLATWQKLLQNCIADADGVSGCDHFVKPDTQDSSENDLTDQAKQLPSELQRHFSKTPFEYDPIPRRDERFQDSFNAGVNPEAFLYDSQFADRDKSLMMFYKRLREIDVPEMMASIIFQTPGKPWKYYRDMSRQLWDEARHAMLGEVGFVSLGLDWSRIPINFTWSRNLNTQLKPWERHAVLFFISNGK